LLAKDGYIQGYNAQVAVDETAQIIVAHELTSSMSDQGQFVPLIDGIEKSLGRKPKEARLTQVIAARPTFKLWPIAASAPMSPRAAPGAPAANSAEPRRATHKGHAAKLKRAGYRSRYRLRKQIVEPVFGQIKQARGFRQFLLRGMEKIRAEWAIICTAHNLTKLAKAASAPTSPGRTAIWTGS
jgi:hypothetical protein